MYFALNETEDYSELLPENIPIDNIYWFTKDDDVERKYNTFNFTLTED